MSNFFIMNGFMNNIMEVWDDLCLCIGVVLWYFCIFELYVFLVFFVDKYVSLILYFIGFVGNFLIIKIWS